MENKQAVIEFEDGKKITINLREDVAPISVNNFIELVKSGFYDGLCFHRIIPGFMIQGGGMTADNGGLNPAKKKAKTIKGEFLMNGIENNLSHKVGVVSMARAQHPDSGSSQFFICVADCSFLDKQYAAFGECADKESIDTAIELSKVPTHSVGYFDDVPKTPVVIKTIKLI